MQILLDRKLRSAREHDCQLCPDPIPASQPHYVVITKQDGDIKIERSHAEHIPWVKEEETATDGHV